MRKTIACAVLIVACAATAKAKSMTQNQRYLHEAQQRASEYETEKDPERLREASVALDNVIVGQEQDPDLQAQVRRDCLSLWLHLIQLLDLTLDRNFDPKQVPNKLVQPPPTNGGVVYPPGADPALIDDPRARAEYEREILANRKKIQDYRIQVHLARLKDRIPEQAAAFIRANYSSAEPDQEELKKAIKETITDPDRKKELKNLLLSLHR
jgi:hypothetical protein